MSRSLARQSLVVAVVAAAVDTAMLVLNGIFAVAPWQATAVVIGIVSADLALAAPPRTAGTVAVAQVVLRLAEAVMLHRHGFAARFADVGFLVAGYRAGAWMVGPKSVATVVTLCTGFAAAHLLVGSNTSHDWRLLVATTVSVGVVPWLVGRYTAARGAYIADLEQQAKLRAQEQRAALARAVTDERAAIARDLHDVISHHVSAIGIHAGAARIAMADTGNAAATRSLTAVESSSRAAMVDLRRQLDLLHGREDDGQRQPGLADIDDLLERVRAAGLAVEFTVRGVTVELPDSLNLTLYRIVQELLTNALRHGDGEHAELLVDYQPNRVVLESTNPLADTVDVAGAAEHRGLSGIRQRAELFGGELTFGLDRAENRWHTRVSLPIGGS
ncbi:histidine kinase [Nocardia sp. NBC_00565]|uniref:sensor histidine kinase n=1 Tax=Nocardia sp. NBC_00565 TaxID=2975993 RepID=UPI002E823958|nr:histidine kinase [Nocardia sp. NBC_00565]WUC08036.1 histidine kinase [Nocardia sp. NBC_00565]